MNEEITIGIPAYKGEKVIFDCLCSIQTQTFKDRIKVVIASDDKKSNYLDVAKMFRDLDIEILPCKKNLGQSLNRQRIIDECNTPWIGFIDQDDIYYNPFAIEQLYSVIDSETVMVTGNIAEENGYNQRVHIFNDTYNPFVNGHLYRVDFLKANNIRFPKLRASEDSEFNYKILALINQTKFKCSHVNETVYLWRCNFDSISRRNRNDKCSPPYTYDMNELSKIKSVFNLIDFLKGKGFPADAYKDYIASHMIDVYFKYVQCLHYYPELSEQVFFCGKWLYYGLYKDVGDKIDSTLIAALYNEHMKTNLMKMTDFIPEITIFEFVNRIRESEFGGKDELIEIRKRIPRNVLENDEELRFEIDFFD